MKRFTFLILAFLLTHLGVFAQNLVIWDSVAHYLPPDTLLIRTGPVDSEGEMLKYLAIKNNSVNPIAICVKKVISDTIPGSKNYICWVRCYSDKIYAPTDTVLLQSQRTDYYHFVGHYRPMEKHGISTIRYVFYDTFNHNDSASVRISYNPTGLAVTEANAVKNWLVATPNPANEEVKFSYSIAPGSTGKITILQITGTIMSETQVQGTHGVLDIDTRQMNEGLYFYYLVADGKICSAKKLIIRHQ